MDYITLITLAFGLSMDAFAVSITNGMSINKLSFTKILIIAISFGIFQGIMPLIGYFSGVIFSDFISIFDHYIALIILGVLGLKMVKDGFCEKYGDNKQKEIIIFTTNLLLIQSIATSIDALAVGINFIAFDVNIYVTATIICIVTSILCFVGGYIGKAFKDSLAGYATIFGGVILISIGLKIFISHVL